MKIINRKFHRDYQELEKYEAGIVLTGAEVKAVRQGRLKYGLPGFYERAQVERFTTTYPNYPPLAIFLFIIAYGLYQFVFKATWRVNLWLPLFPSKLVIFLEKRQALAGFMKLPAVFFDLALVVLIYRWIRMKKDKNNIFGPLAAVSFILFNPGFFYNSSYFGQIESIPLFFILLSLYLLFFSKMHERHLQQALPFLLVVGLKDKKFLKAFFYFSLVYFINIYHNWPVPKIIFLENFVNSPMVVNGVIIVSLIVYSWLVANYYADKKNFTIFLLKLLHADHCRPSSPFEIFPRRLSTYGFGGDCSLGR